MSLDAAVEEILVALRSTGSTGSITVLTGAGISAESGVATFRGAEGLWERHRVEDVATPEAFSRRPRLVLDFYNARRRQVRGVAPNPAHFAIARLEGALCPAESGSRRRFTLITQNVDDLHERAGTREVLHMHGELLKARCSICAQVRCWPGDMALGDLCACGGQVRPHVVWFGEVPFYLEDRIPRALDAEVFIAIGTSGNVYPAAGMVREAALRGKLTVEVNLEPGENSRHFALHVHGRAGEVVPRLVEGILQGLARER